MANVQGFVKAKKGNNVKRLIVSAEGKERTGKTSFGLSAPGPLVYLPLDPGMEGVIDKYLADKEVWLPTKDKNEIETFNYRDVTSQDEWEKMWEKFKSTFEKGLISKEVKSLIVDTATEAWELIRLARLGKLSNVKPHHYGPVNAEFRNMIKRVYETDKNLILIHKVKKEYVDDKTTGEMERAGFGDVGYLVQINVVTTWSQDEGFAITLRDCRQNMDIAGMTLSAPMNTFPYLASQVYPNTDPEQWE